MSRIRVQGNHQALNAAKRLRAEIAAVRADIDAKTFTASDAESSVTVTIDGTHKVLEVVLSDSAVTGQAFAAAMNAALEMARAYTAEKMGPYNAIVAGI